MAEPGTTMSGFRDPETSEENLLINRLNRIEANPTGFYAVHIHLSKLRAGNRQPHFINIAARSFDGLIESHEATLFPLSNKDLVLICGNVPVDETDVPLDKVRGLFGEDPLMKVEEGAFEDNFSTWYDLSQPDDYRAFLAVAKELMVEALKIRQREAEDRARTDRDQGNPLGAMNLAAINQKLQGTRVADLIREQVCLQFGVKGPGAVVFRENYISMTDLKKRIAPEVNLFSSPWLFQYLTETLDKRVLAVMANREFETLADAVSLNLNVGTVLSRDFQNFHRAVGDHAKKVVVEMQVLDVFADMNTFGYARDSLQERGYRVLIDGLSPLALQFFDPWLLRADFVKVNWSAEFEGELDDKRKSELREVVASTGKDRMILARVDTEDAVKWGLSLGISRFQGFFIDDLVAKVLAVKDKKSVTKAAAKAPVQAPAPAKAPAPAQAPAQAKAPAPAKAPAQAKAPAPAKVPAPAQAPAPAPATAAPKPGTV